jgi:hypothetical protein
MARNDLPLGQIAPAAQPVESFITPARIDPAAPAKPSALPQGPQIGMVQRASGGNVQSNYGDLAQALAPFNANLTKALYTGAELYASNEYKQGQNEAMRAYTLANRQMLQSEAEYGSVNRKLAQANPMAALAMDNANPFRQGGRVNQLSQLAGSVIESRLSAGYQNNRMQLAQLDPGSPEINALKAGIITKTAQEFGISESSPGFIDYVMPKVTQGWDKITERQISDRNAYMKDAAKDTLLAQLQQIGINGLANGNSQSQIKEAWQRALDEQVAVAGLPGEASEIAKYAITGASQMFIKGGKSNLASWLGSIAVGAPGKDGFRPSAAMVLGPDLIIANDKINDIQWKEYQRGQELQLTQFSGEVGAAVLGMDNGPAKSAALMGMLNNPKYAGLSTAAKLKALNDVSSQSAEFTALGQDPERFEQWLTGVDQRHGTAWDPKKVLAELEGALADVPDKDRPRARERVRDLINTKNTQKRDMPNATINAQVGLAIKANNANFYPTLQEAGVRRMNGQAIEDNLAWGLANRDASTARQNSAYKKAVYRALDVATGKKGGPLTQAEKEEVIETTISGFQKNAPETWKTLFPGVEGYAPSVKPGAQLQANPDGKAPAPAAAAPKPYQGQTFSAGTLDSVPENRLKGWRGEPLLKKESAVDVVESVLNGGSFPAPLVRAARKAGTTPGQLLLHNLDNFYPGEVKLAPEDRRTLLKKGQQVSSVDRYSNAVASSGESPVWKYATEWALRVIAPPAMAAEPTFPQVAMRMQTSQPSRLDGGSFPAGELSGNAGRLRRAIVGKESGGNYGAVNPDSGALGIGQVMPANVPSWTQKYFGRALTPQQFLRSKPAQDAVVNGRMRDMIADQEKAGFRGEVAIRRAAAVWYSGKARRWNDNSRETYNGRSYPSVAEYTRDIWRAYRSN